MTPEHKIGTLLRSHNLKGNLSDVLKCINDLTSLINEEKNDSYDQGYIDGLNVQLKEVEQ